MWAGFHGQLQSLQTPCLSMGMAVPLLLQAVQTGGPPQLHCLHTLGCIFHYLKVAFKKCLWIWWMPLKGPPAFFLQATPCRPHLHLSWEILFPEASLSSSLNSWYSQHFPKTRSPRTLLKGSAKSSQPWMAPILVAWLNYLAKPDCPKWCLTSVLSLMVSGARHWKIIVFFLSFFLHKNIRAWSQNPRCAAASMAVTESCCSGGCLKDFQPVTSLHWERLWERALTRSLLVNGAATRMTESANLSLFFPSQAGPPPGWEEPTWSNQPSFPSFSFYWGEGQGTWNILI